MGHYKHHIIDSLVSITRLTLCANVNTLYSAPDATKKPSSLTVAGSAGVELSLNVYRTHLRLSKKQ